MRNISIRTSRQTSVPIDIVRTTGLGNIRGRLFPATFPTKLFAHRDYPAACRMACTGETRRMAAELQPLTEY